MVEPSVSVVMMMELCFHKVQCSKEREQNFWDFMTLTPLSSVSSCLRHLLPSDSVDRVAHRLDEGLRLLGQNIWSDTGNVAPSVNGEMTSVVLQ